MADKRTIFVAGATGQQGGSVAHAALKRGHRVRGLTRKPDSEAAKALAALGAEIVAGDLNDPASVTAAAKGADTAFLVGNWVETGADKEAAQSIGAANAIKAAGVGHLVYTSVASADKKTGIPHFDSKYEVETHLKSLGVPYSVSAPVAFMENVAAPWAIAPLFAGKLAVSLPPKRTNQLIAVADIGPFVVSLIERRDAVFGKRYDIAGDQIDGETQAAIIAQASGKPIQYEEIPRAVVRQHNPEAAKMFDWFDDVGYSADIAGLKREFPELSWQTFAEWAKTFDWSILNGKPPSNNWG